MKDTNEVKAFIRQALESIYNNEKYGKPLAHDANFQRFWEGRLVEVAIHKKNLEKILEMLDEDRICEER